MTKIKVKRGDIDFRGYEVARTQFFTSVNMISVTFSRRYIRFSSDCVRKFSGTEYIELLVHPTDNIFAVRPCSSEYKNAMHWANIRADKLYGREISGAAFLDTMYELFYWNPDHKYRFRGEILQHGGERIASFDVSAPEIIIPRKIVSLDNVEEERQYSGEDAIYIATQTKRTLTALPLHWQGNFGDDFYSHKNMLLPDVPIGDTFASYNSQPELQPTAPDIIGENVRKLIAEMQTKEGLNGDTSVIHT